ncbi:MAG: nucleotidyltransferase domain-containing protein [Trueperaceae bacterium]
MKSLESLLTELKQDNNALSIVLIGSGSRNELDAYSDLDIHIIVRSERPPDRMFYQDGRLVTINFWDKANRELMFTDPWYTIKNLGAVKEALILYDPKDWYRTLQQRARSFIWVSWVLAENAEEIQKILGGLSKNNFEKALHATTRLMLSSSNVAALTHGVLCNSENKFWSSVRDAEPDEVWNFNGQR